MFSKLNGLAPFSCRLLPEPRIQMFVRDETGRALGSAPIGPGEDTPGGGCEYRFLLEDIPKAESYRFAQSTGWQDQRVYSFEEMQEMGWKVKFSSFRK